MKNKAYFIIPLVLGLILGAVLVVALILNKKQLKQEFNNQGFQSDNILVNNLDSDYLNQDIIQVELSKLNREPIKILFLGDLMLDRYVGELISRDGLSSLLDSLKLSGVFDERDLISVNLEGAVTEDGAHYPPDNLYDFAFHPDLIEELKDEYDFNYFALANNHISDQGLRGIEETRFYLDEMGLNFSGSADAKIDKHSRQDLELRGKKLALISLSMVYNHFNENHAKELIETAKDETDFVIINIHWGNEYQHNFNTYQQNVAHYLVDSGADLIIGHHPHVVQGMEIYQGKAIFYSLGNFIFDQYFSTATQEGLGISADILSDKINLKLIPFSSKRSVVQLMDDLAQTEFLKRFISWSKLNDLESDLILNNNLSLSWGEAN